MNGLFDLSSKRSRTKFVEVVKDFIPNELKLNNQIILDIHRPENFKYENRLGNIIEYSKLMGKEYDLPLYMLGFKRTLEYIKKFNINLDGIKIIDLLPFKEYINQVYHSRFIISDSGTAQEELSLLNTPVIVPRDFTERPESIENDCSFMIDVNSYNNNLTWSSSEAWLLLNSNKRNTKWLGDGNTSDLIINILKEKL